ncbi:MAG: sulfite reductase subunit alpha, partial [Planctomycetota bacterium]
PGDNWLFFGDQKGDTDYLYRDQINDWVEAGVLNRVSTAFSRDQEKKVYVQHRMLEEAEELWAWLDRGGYFFVCGDAKRMAADVDKALHEVIAGAGGKGADGAKKFIEEMKSDGRYSRDVY